jgi:hypothetical protein
VGVECWPLKTCSNPKSEQALNYIITILFSKMDLGIYFFIRLSVQKLILISNSSPFHQCASDVKNDEWPVKAG